MNWETVIGLEIHVELATKSKIFCGCTTLFGGEPNTHCCPVCMGFPGTLPVLNERVLEFAVKAGIALNCNINRYNKFDRKNYFYPDLPKAYQISQLYLPFCQNGSVDVTTKNGNKTTIRIHEIHMEEDAGKLIHSPFGDETYTDYNRCGVPLIEIVTEPDFRSADEVTAFLEQLKSKLEYLGVSDCKMQEGSMRADVNLSVKRAGDAQLGTRTEMKNMNSLKAIANAIAFETKRQIDLLEHGESVRQQTRRWNDNRGKSTAMRDKENAHDYRYFPEPDIPPITISDEMLTALKAAQPEFAEAKAARYMETFGLSKKDAANITLHKQLADLFEKTAELTKNPREVGVWILGDLMFQLKETGTLVENFFLPVEKFAEFIGLIEKGTVNRTVGKEIFAGLFKDAANFDIQDYVKKNNLAQSDDGALIAAAVDAVLIEQAETVEAYKGGKTKVFASLVGETMKKLGGKANPKEINRILKEKIGG